MARFSVGGDEDGNEEGSNNDRRLPKRPRTAAAAASIVYTAKRSNASSSNSGDRAGVSSSANPPSCSAAPADESRPEEPALVEEISEDESEEESDSSLSDSEEEEEESEDGFEDEEEEEDQQNPRSGDEVQPPVGARLDSAANVNGAAHVEAPHGGDTQAAVSVTLTDPDVLDCPICLEPLSSPIYQCDNGHIACAVCCIKMRNRCASCCLPIGYNRCRAIEKVLESVRISCRNMQHGCTASINYSKKLDHEKTCTYTPCSCPYPGCTYLGSAKCLYTHFTTAHPRSSKLFRFNCAVPISLSNNQKHLFLQDRHEQTLFVLNRSIEPFGSYFNIICIGPTSSNPPFACDLAAREGVDYILLKTVAETTPQCVAAQPPMKKRILIPKEFMALGDELHLELTISKDANRRTV